MPEQLFLGIDIGGTKTAAALVTGTGTVISVDHSPTPVNPGGTEILENAVKLGRRLCSTIDISQVRGIGVGAGGQIDSVNGVVVSATDVLPGWTGIRIKDGCQAAFPHTQIIAVDNDVNALAYGEWRFGVANGSANAIFLALGTGVGGAAIIDGKLIHGSHWSGAEFGHLLLSIADDSRIDTGGSRGTLEAYVSGPGLIQTWREITGRDSEITGHQITEEAQLDPFGHSAEAIAQTGIYLGYGLVSLANIFDPEIIVIGGGLASLGNILLEPARMILRKYALPGPSKAKVITASLGPNASVIGAASLSIQ